MSNRNLSDLDMVLVRDALGILMRIEEKEKEGNEQTDTERPLNDLSLCNDIYWILYPIDVVAFYDSLK